jgi:conjugative relaxase-like TrwC/TraI family protein
VLVFRPVGRGQAGYYLNGPHPGRWLGSGCAALGLEGHADAATFPAMLDGRGPDGSLLLARVPTNRRAGFDLVFAAPKSVSLLAALAPPVEAAALVGAHDAAVVDVIDHLERWAALTRRGHDQGRIATEGFIAAAFLHHTSRADDPHLHTHVVIANLVRGTDGRWSCLDRFSLARYARAAGAVYQASLRDSVTQTGMPLEWVVRADGLADVAGVPRPAIDACSSRRRETLADLARTPMTSSSRARAVAAGRTRQTARRHEQGWEARAATAGLDRAVVADLLTSQPADVGAPRLTDIEHRLSGQPADAGASRLHDTEVLLAARASSFTHADVIAAVATTAPSGARSADLDREAQRFLRTALRIDGTRWTTPRMVQRDEALAEAVAGRTESFGRAAEDAVETAMAGRQLSADGRAAVRRLTAGGAAVDVVGAPSLVDQAAVVDAARVAWEASGHRVAVVAGSERSQARWRALTGLGPPPPPPARPSVVIVDGADRLSSIALGQLVDDTTGRGAKLVLVVGGTGLARQQPTSHALTSLMHRLPTVQLGSERPLSDPVPDAVHAGLDGTVRVVPNFHDAAFRMTADWHEARRDRATAVMVALGPDEAEYLNVLARARRVSAGELTGPVLRAGSRDLQAGDEIRVLHRDRRLAVPAGAVGLVVGVDTGRMEATVQWSERRAAVPVAALAGPSLTHAYATTPAYVRPGDRGQLFVLGPPAGIGFTAGVTAGVTAYVVAGEALWRPRGLDPVEDMVAALDPPIRPVRGKAERTLAELGEERDRLGARLGSEAPRSVTAELRRAEEDRVWLAATAATDDRGGTAGGEQREDSLRRQHADRARWLEAHRDELERWVGLDAAIAWRTQALAVGAELAPTRAVADRLGGAPQDEGGRRAWRRAATAIEVYRDRWALPDEPLPHSRSPAADWDRTRQSDHLQLTSACRTAERAASLERAAGDELAISAR